MIPTSQAPSDEITNNLPVVNAADLPTATYYMNLKTNKVRNKVDGKNAMQQLIFKTLQTERYQYSKIYSNNFGVEFNDLYGTPPEYAQALIPKRITEALTWDERITSVSDFEFTKDKGVISVNFIAHTIFGDVEINDVQVKI